MPRTETLRYRAFAALAFLIAAAPFVYLYTGTRPDTDVDPKLIASAIRSTIPRDYQNVGLALQHFQALARQPPRVYYWITAVGGILAVFALGGAHRERLKAVLLWTAGVATVAIGLSWADQARSLASGEPPLQVDLIRSIRYFVPLMLIFALWPLAALYRRFDTAGWKMRAPLLAVGLAMTVVWVRTHPPLRPLTPALRCLQRGRVVCPPNNRTPVRAALEAIREHTPTGARLVTTTRNLAPAIRYFSQRPVAHAWRDISVHLYATRNLLPAWRHNVRELARLPRIADRAKRFEKTIAFARSIDADYALIDLRFFPEKAFPSASDRRYQGWLVPWSNRAHALVEVSRHRTSQASGGN